MNIVEDKRVNAIDGNYDLNRFINELSYQITAIYYSRACYRHFVNPCKT